MTKIIKEMLPPDVRVARDAQDLLIECCVGETNVILWLLSNLIFFLHIISIDRLSFFPPLIHLQAKPLVEKKSCV